MSTPLQEPIRLVIWDLDETFWRGTLTEGGIKEYVQSHHDVIIELAKRGIMSSICSKNRREDVLPILTEKSILDYFIFPSISWEPKGPRISEIVNAANLRAPTVMFIDDNPNNRADALRILPDLQVEDENFIPKILNDPRFKGKNDASLSRLKQYKLLEARQQDQQKSVGDDENFLRGCDIRVQFEYDIETHIDRAIELINRTNQLNYTKFRLPEDLSLAREELRKQLRPFDRVAALVKVYDRYGDYGYVGFFMYGAQRKKLELGAANSNLIHYCFSCRTLGMLVEQWVYNYLGRPEIVVRGDVLTALSDRPVDWIREAPPHENTQDTRTLIAPQITIFGGCEANSIGAYLRSHTDKLVVYGNYVSNGIMMRVNYARRMLDISDREPASISQELDFLELPRDLETGDIFGPTAPGTLFVVNFGIDADGGPRLENINHGWSLAFDPPWMYWETMLCASEDEIFSALREFPNLSEKEIEKLLSIARHIRSNYRRIDRPDDLELAGDLRQVIERIPKDSRLIILIEQDLRRDKNDWESFISISRIKRYREIVESIAQEYSFVTTVAIADCINSNDEILEANHYNRAVYFRISRRIIDACAGLPVRDTYPESKITIANRIYRNIDRQRSSRDAEEFVEAIYQALLRRDPEAGLTARVANDLVKRRISPGGYVRAIAQCREFAMKWERIGHG